ncbi:MAG: PEP-CTERM sorting domain-containing protein [Planctomycetes bacterium]|nr:PEP-CTERM sorting domain-containing protein [Planctomycetota bacterium]
MRQLVVALLACLLAGVPAAWADVSLQSLGSCNVSGADRYDLMATGISADGSVIVGVVGGSTGPLFRWTAATGAVLLTDGAGDPLVGGSLDVSYDGSTMAGTMSTSSGYRPFTMTAGGTPTVLSMPAGATGVDGAYISADGSTIGGSFSGTEYGYYTWTSSTSWQGTLCNLGAPEQASGDFTASIRSPGYWTQAGGQAYFDPPSSGYPYGPVMVMSGDGTAIAASGYYDSGMFGSIWRASTGWQPMQGAPGSMQFEQLTPCGISDDGSVVLGITVTGDQAVFWSEDSGWLGLQDFLQGNGIDVLSLFPNGLDALTYPRVLLSADGSTIAGFATKDGMAYVAVIPEPATMSLLGLGLGVTLLRRRRAK